MMSHAALRCAGCVAYRRKRRFHPVRTCRFIVKSPRTRCAHDIFRPLGFAGDADVPFLFVFFLSSLEIAAFAPKLTSTSLETGLFSLPGAITTLVVEIFLCAPCSHAL